MIFNITGSYLCYLNPLLFLITQALASADLIRLRLQTSKDHARNKLLDTLLRGRDHEAAFAAILAATPINTD